MIIQKKRDGNMNKNKIIISFILILLLSSVSFAVSREEAVSAIQQAEIDMYIMTEEGFSVNYINDTLFSARQALERADFAELIRNNATGALADFARKALEGLDYEGFTYDDVLKYTQEIATRKQKAYELSDYIRATEIKMQTFKEQGVNTTEAERIMGQGKTAFEKERYDETETLLADVNTELDNKRAETTAVNLIVISSQSFIEKNWRELSILIIVIFVVSWFSWRHYRIKRAEKRLRKMIAEKDSLIKLIKKTQADRFKKRRISESVYKLRSEKYRKRLNELNETIPTLRTIIKRAKHKPY